MILAQKSPFVWVDLSTYHLKESIEFYSNVFEWNIIDSGSGYFIAYQNDIEVAGFYETPAFFKKINMPHFWMSYIQVDDCEKTVSIANRLGAKVEIADEAFYEGKISLIRDPQGAGFTIYDGQNFSTTRRQNSSHNIWNELHVSNAADVIEFYELLFGWKIINRDSDMRYPVLDSQGNQISSIHEIPNDIKGKYEYWAVSFASENLEETRNKILNQGGKIISKENERTLFTDLFGEAFFYVQEL